MSSYTDLVPPSEQLCYIPCNFCNIVLGVYVPSSSLMETVTVRCGRCSNMSSVNMMTASIRSIAVPDFQVVPKPDHNAAASTSSSKTKNKVPMRAPPVCDMVNRPPEKRQRVPSAYNQFIKEEIQRIKTNNPGITHREAFSTAAKNWAHFPHAHYGFMSFIGETNNKQPSRLSDTNSDQKRSSMSRPTFFK